jgi:hypothetical protein
LSWVKNTSIVQTPISWAYKEINGIVVLSNLHPATFAGAVLFSVADAFLGGEARDWSVSVMRLLGITEFKRVVEK